MGTMNVRAKTVARTGSDSLAALDTVLVKKGDERPETAGSRASRASRGSRRSRRSDRSARSRGSRASSRGSRRPSTAGSQRSLSQSAAYRALVNRATGAGVETSIDQRRAMKRAVVQKLRDLQLAIDDERRARTASSLQLNTLCGELGVLRAGAAAEAEARARQARANGPPERKEKDYGRRRSDVTRAYEDQIKSSSQDREIARIHRLRRRGHAAAAEAAMQTMLRGDGKLYRQKRFAKPPSRPTPEQAWNMPAPVIIGGFEKARHRTATNVTNFVWVPVYERKGCQGPTNRGADYTESALDGPLWK